MADFGQQVEALAERYKKRLRAVAKESVQTTIKMAQRTRGEGGRMRVDTGFLRASLVAGIGVMPAGKLTAGKETYSYDGAAISVALLKWNPERGETIFVGWATNYARPREALDGFLRGATEKWDQTVNETAARVKLSI